MIYSQSALLLLAALLAPSSFAQNDVASTTPPPCSSTTHKDKDVCSPGCWNPDNIFLRGDEELHCIPTKPGHYSPADSNEELPCPEGHASSQPQATMCSPCPSGTMATPDGTSCLDCPTGSYQDLSAKSICKSCKSARYSGQGANAVTEEGYCLLLNVNEDTTDSNDLSFSKPSCTNTKGTCAAGCWNQDDVRLQNGDRVCVAVEPGYYSPATSNNRLQCEKGHVSAEFQSEECTPCRPGSMAHPNGTGCITCPRGTYQDAFGGKVCYGCNPEIYGGPGANVISPDGHCLIKKDPNQVDWKVSKHVRNVQQERRRRRRQNGSNLRTSS